MKTTEGVWTLYCTSTTTTGAHGLLNDVTLQFSDGRNQKTPPPERTWLTSARMFQLGLLRRRD